MIADRTRRQDFSNSFLVEDAGEDTILGKCDLDKFIADADALIIFDDTKAGGLPFPHRTHC